MGRIILVFAIVVGAIGGGFSFSGSVVPRVGAVGRVISLALGAVLVFGGLVLDPALQPAAPTPEAVAQHSDNRTVDQQVVDLLSSRASFAGFSGT